MRSPASYFLFLCLVTFIGIFALVLADELMTTMSTSEDSTTYVVFNIQAVGLNNGIFTLKSSFSSVF